MINNFFKSDFFLFLNNLSLPDSLSVQLQNQGRHPGCQQEQQHFQQVAKMCKYFKKTLLFYINCTDDIYLTR